MQHKGRPNSAALFTFLHCQKAVILSEAYFSGVEGPAFVLRFIKRPHSYRSATTGSTFIAARAGISVAANATIPSKSSTAA
jgi:hypothetical protein